MFKPISSNAGLKVTIYEVVEVRDEAGTIVGSLKRTERMSPETLERRSAAVVDAYLKMMSEDNAAYKARRNSSSSK